MFDPDVLDPCVKEYGIDKYGLIIRFVSLIVSFSHMFNERVSSRLEWIYWPALHSTKILPCMNMNRRYSRANTRPMISSDDDKRRSTSTCHSTRIQPTSLCCNDRCAADDEQIRDLMSNMLDQVEPLLNLPSIVLVDDDRWQPIDPCKQSTSPLSHDQQSNSSRTREWRCAYFLCTNVVRRLILHFKTRLILSSGNDFYMLLVMTVG
jgi:hypothetical protein